MANKRKAIISSMLWAAYGDALGFISELANPAQLKGRLGSAQVQRLTRWRRRIGGRFGISVELPTGTYSDDTQLRLSTCRAIRNDGFFDVEAFARVELPVWLSYALGAGKGTQAAARALAQTTNSWWANFFETEQGKYLDGGGNGGAMRVQPHVWAGRDHQHMLRDVVRNTIVTHGHPRAFVGAAFHAISLRRALEAGTLPSPGELPSLMHELHQLPEIIKGDDQLSSFWLPVWEEKSKVRLEDAVRTVIAECDRDLGLIASHAHTNGNGYRSAAQAVGAYEPETRGSATKTAILASYAAWLFREDAHAGMLCIVNALGTDTDTIATMCGALLGAVHQEAPSEELADQEYLRSEAERMAHIAEGEDAASFRYPDLLRWNPPRAMLDVVGLDEQGVVIAGLGAATPISDPILQSGSSPSMWQWMQLSFGQKVFIKRRTELQSMQNNQLPADSRALRVNPKPVSPKNNQRDLFPRPHPPPPQAVKPAVLSVDEAFESVSRANFEPTHIGQALRMLSEQEGGVDRAVAFAAIVAKAINARARRHSQQSSRTNEPDAPTQVTGAR